MSYYYPAAANDEIAALKARAEKAEARADDAEVNYASACAKIIDLRNGVAVVEARAERLAAYVRADIALHCAALGDAPNAEMVEKQATKDAARAAVNAAGDLGGAA